MQTTSRSAYRILFADDDSLTLRAYGLTFDRANSEPEEDHEAEPAEALEFDEDRGSTRFDVDYCAQGKEAVKAVHAGLLSGQPYSVAFLDMHMPPGIDGVETARRIRELDPDINIVFITGHSDVHPEKIARRVPPVDKLLYCQKPVHPMELRHFAVALSSKWKTEQEMKTLNERMHLLLRSNPAVLYSTGMGADHAGSYVSENVEAVFGYDPAEFLDRPDFWQRNIHPEDLPDVQERVRNMDDDDQWYVEYRLRMADGEYRRVGDHVNIHRDETGRVAELIGCWVDLSQRSQWEQGLLSAKEEAEAAHRAKTEFLANISHELRTPLNAILGFTQILCDQPERMPTSIEKYKEYTAIIHESGRRLLDTIDDLLDVAKIESGRFEIHESTFPFESMLRRTLRLVATQAEAARVTVEAALPDRLEAIYADEPGLKQALLNVLSNAVKFTRPGGHVVLEAGISDKGEPWFAVSDTGIGMSAAQADMAVKPFAQAECHLSRRYEGSGLGLYLTKSIVELHGGTVAITSEPDKGTRVTVTLPAKRSFPEAPAAKSAS